MSRPKLLLINPHIEDFAAYDHYTAPLGLLNIAAYLSESADIHFINALTRNPRSGGNSDGTGPFQSIVLPAPSGLEDIPRTYRRYGMSESELSASLQGCPFEPDFILLTSGMTYWYTGIIYSISIIRSIYPDTPIILGGIYASLLPEHAQDLKGVDHVIAGQDRRTVMAELSQILNINIPAESYRQPLYSLLKQASYYPVMSSRGCVFHCHYCASPALSGFEQFPARVLAEMVLDLHARTGVSRFPFYDDALLVHADQHIDVFLKMIIDSGKRLQFYTPNGLHVKFLNKHTAQLMKQGGFQEVRISLESSDNSFMEREGVKTSREEFVHTVKNLTDVGFTNAEIKVYTLANVPGQDPSSILHTIDWIWEQGAVPFLAFYSPIPGTPDYKKASLITDVTEPLFQNNTVYLYRSGFDPDFYQTIRSRQNHYRRLSLQ